MSRLSTEDDSGAIANLTTDALKYSGLILTPGIIGAAVIGDRLMRVYGPGFEIGEQVLVILIFSLIIYSYTNQLLNTLNAIDRPDLAFRANGAFVLANIILNILLVYTIGWVGAAIATATSAGIGFLLGIHYTRKHVPFTIPYGEIIRQWIAAFGMGAVVYAVRAFGEAQWAWVPDYNTLFVVNLVGLGAAVYFILLVGISQEFRITVANNLPFDVPIFES